MLSLSVLVGLDYRMNDAVAGVRRQQVECGEA